MYLHIICGCDFQKYRNPLPFTGLRSKELPRMAKSRTASNRFLGEHNAEYIAQNYELIISFFLLFIESDIASTLPFEVE